MKVRLLKVVVQPVFVLDDGEELTEVQHPATVIPAAEWPMYSNERFPREVAEWQAKLDADNSETTTREQPASLQLASRDSPAVNS